MYASRQMDVTFNFSNTAQCLNHITTRGLYTKGTHHIVGAVDSEEWVSLLKLLVDFQSNFVGTRQSSL
jgi:hypothetical protein